jgi:hypothetical protein
MAVRKVSNEELLEAYRVEGGSSTRVANRVGMSVRAAVARMRGLGVPPLTGELGGAPKRLPLKAASKAEFTIAPLPSDDIDIEELVEHRIKAFQKKVAHADATKAIPVQIKIRGPIGILHFGDPHVDDDGTDLKTLREHSDLTHVEGVFGANVGDTTNNWVGRLAKLYAEQATTADQAWKLAEWFIARTRWLYMLGGNHDCHDTETEALTKRGWLHHDQITDDDEVLSFDPDSGAAKWQPILRRVVREHSGEMVSVSTQSVNFRVTPSHRILCRDRDWKRDWREWKFITADSLPARVALPVSGLSEAAGVDLSEDQIALAGWILTDGTIYWAGNSPRITLYQSKDGSEITRLLDALGLEYRYSVRNRAVANVCGRKLVSPPLPQQEWTLTADASREVLKFLPEKGRLPDWCQQLSQRQFEVLLDALVAGDGTWDGVDPAAKNVAVLHGEKAFLDSVQALAVQHGWYARISVARQTDYRLNLCRRDTIQFETKPATERVNYTGTVWCLTVPLGNFMVRRNGAAHFSGNCWSGSGDPLKWIARQAGALYQPSSARLKLQFPNGREVIVNARHDFAGHSQYNPAHGVAKALMFGVRDHIAVAGHRHVSGYGIIKDPDTGRVCHALQVASYKLLDRYALEKGFRDQRISPAAFTVIDPGLPETHPDMVKLFWDPVEGVEYLNWRRQRAA